MARDAVVPVPVAAASLNVSRRRTRVVRLARYALGLGYVTYFVHSYRRHGFPFDRERVMLWIAAALVITSVGRGWRWAVRLVIDWLPFAVLLLAYDYSYGFVKQADRHVLVFPLVRIDELLFAGQVPAVWLQRHIDHAHAIGWWELAVSIIYASHFVVPFVLAGFLWWRSRRLWRQWVARLLTASFSAVLIYAAVPTGAPWYAASRGLIPAIDRPVGRGWLKIGLHAAPVLLQRGRQFVNPYAALPSLHATYSFLFALFLYRLVGRGRWRLLAFIYPMAMAFVLVYGGEHFVIDILAGWALAAASSSVCTRLERRWRTRTASAQAESDPEVAVEVDATVAAEADVSA